MGKIDKNIIKRIAIRILLSVVVVVLLLPIMLYIPFVQTAVKDFACKKVGETVGLDITMDRLLLKFPLEVSLDGVSVSDEKGELGLSAGHADVDIKLLPLFRLELVATTANLTDATYKMVSSDSSIVLSADIKDVRLNLAEVALECDSVYIEDIALNGGNISMEYYQEKVEDIAKEESENNWKIALNKISLEDVHYSMTMMPVIDKLDVNLGLLELQNGIVDMGKSIVDAEYVGVDKLDVRYFYPKGGDKADNNKIEEIDSVASIPWTVNLAKVKLTNSDALYAAQGAKPGQGLDMEYIEVKKINFEVDSVYNRGSNVRIPIKRFSAEERGGLRIVDVNGAFEMNDSIISIKNLKLRSALSSIFLDGNIDMSFFDPKLKGGINVNSQAEIYLAEVQKMYPLYSKFLSTIPQTYPVEMKMDISGDSRKLKVNSIDVNLKNYARVDLNGVISDVMDSKKLGGAIALKGRFDNINFVKASVLDSQMGKFVEFPPMDIAGDMKLSSGNIAGGVAMTLSTGEAVGNIDFNSYNEEYQADVKMSAFPLHAFMPLSKFGDIDMSVVVQGKGLDIYNPNTKLSGDVSIDHLHYNGIDYHDITGSVSLQDETCSLLLDSKNDNIDFALDARCGIAKDKYLVALDGDIRDLDLGALNIIDFQSAGRMKINAFGGIDIKTFHGDLSAEINDLKWVHDTMNFVTPNVSMMIESGDSMVSAALNNEDMAINFSSQLGVNDFIDRLKGCVAEGEKQLNKIYLSVDSLQTKMPPFSLDFEMGKRGLVQQYLKSNDIKLNKLMLEICNDTTIYGRGYAYGLDFVGTRVDTLTAKIVQTGRYLDYLFHMGNQSGTMDNFASATVKGGVLGSRLITIYDVKDIHQRTGYHLGTNMDVNDSIVRMSIFTPEPRIGYKDWTVNDDNYVQYNYKEKHLDAKLRLNGGKSGAIDLFTSHGEEHGQDDVNLKVSGVKLAEWVSMIPFAPNVKGELNTDMKISYHGSQFWGKGNAGIKDFYYEGEKVGDFNMDALMTLDPVTGSTNLEADMDVNGSKVVFAAGVLNDSTSVSPMSLTLKIDKFPLSTMSAFIPNGVAKLQGVLNGEMRMAGTMDRPVFSGNVYTADGAIYVPMFGSKILFPNIDIPVDSNVVKFNKYPLKSCNDKPLVINGYIDITDMNNPYVNLRFWGTGVQFVDSKQVKKSQLFGRGFANLRAQAKGRTSALYVDADVALLSGSNLTYVLQEDVSDIVTETNADMVKFVHFDDSVGEYSDTLLRAESFGLNLNASLSILQGSIINAYLSTDGKNRVQVQAMGNINYTQGFSGEPRLTGRLNVDKGYVKYTPPLIKEVNFAIREGSNITFTGDMLNPTLDFVADEKYKATVSGDGASSRLVDFLITCNVGGTLSKMDIGFDLSTNDDMTIQNELQSKTKQQRSSQAMNLMLYGSYSGSSSAMMGNNALYSFLNSQLNSWAASAIKGVDLSFGINQYDKDNTGQSVTSYSYNLSKSLFNDRFKIVVGGNYSSDASAEDNFSENLISDISIEYLLNSSGSMYTRLFRHTGFESILEGEVTQTGVGFVLKRKLNSLKDIFNFRSTNNRLRYLRDTTNRTMQKVDVNGLSSNDSVMRNSH